MHPRRYILQISIPFSRGWRKFLTLDARSRSCRGVTLDRKVRSRIMREIFLLRRAIRAAFLSDILFSNRQQLPQLFRSRFVYESRFVDVSER